MKSLFLRIFLSFWLALALFVVIAILVTLAMRPPRENASIEALQNKYLEDAVTAFQHGGVEELRRYSRDLRDSQHIGTWLYDDKDQEVTGRRPPDWIDGVQKGRTHTIESIWGRISPMQFLHPSMTTADGRHYSMVIQLPPEQRTLFGPHANMWLGIVIAVLSSGLVCYPLARYLSAPVVRLRAATQKLAAGDLSARAGAPRFGRRDEMAELLRDFDSMAERLEKLIKAQSRLLSDISHELRSPLARLNVALALARQRSGADAQSSLDRVELEAERLNELIGRLLTIARLESGEETLQKYPVDLCELVSEIAADANFEAQQRHCQVQASVAEDCFVIGDPNLLHSAIENVIRNATRYTQEGTQVKVQVLKRPGSKSDEALIQVSDAGPGVPSDSLEKIFRPFYRIDDARGRRTGGVGLGLAITQRAVRLHGGSVTASNIPSGGLLVEICIPLAKDQPAEPPDSPAVPELEHQA